MVYLLKMVDLSTAMLNNQMVIHQQKGDSPVLGSWTHPLLGHHPFVFAINVLYGRFLEETSSNQHPVM